MKNTENNPRRDFLKRIPFAIFTIGAFSFLKIRKSNKFSDKTFKTLSKSETDEIIRSEEFSAAFKLNPSPAPIAGKFMG